jgi:[acyl-carrier-protein] S-malonyltransferase
MGDAFKPDMVGGHSLGEFSALVAAGALSFEDGLKLVSKRAMAMQKACEAAPSTMAAIIGLADEQIDTLSSSVTPDTAKEIVELMKANSEAAVKKAKEEALKDFKSPDGGKPAPEKSFSEMTLDELTELKRTDPARYEMLKNSKK